MNIAANMFFLFLVFLFLRIWQETRVHQKQEVWEDIIKNTGTFYHKFYSILLYMYILRSSCREETLFSNESRALYNNVSSFHSTDDDEKWNATEI